MSNVKHMYIGGELVESGETHDVISPATGKVVGTIAWGGEKETLAALDAAKAALDFWPATPVEERISWMLKLRDEVVAHADQLRTAVANEAGKPWEETAEDVDGVIDSLTYYAEEIRGFLTPTELPDLDGSYRNEMIYEPVGVVGAFLAWNFPLLNLGYKLGPAMAAGCPIVIKPSSKTPLSAYLVGELCEKIGLPAGIVNIISGDNAAVGDTLSRSTIPSMLTLIGSGNVARRIMELGSSSIKRYSMELGGNAPALVFNDADLDLAVDIVAGLKFKNAGQICVTPNRVFVHTDIADTFTDMVVQRAETVRIGFGPEGTVDMGPLIEGSALNRIKGLVDDAVAKGATVLTGGGRAESENGGTYFQPTVLRDVTPDMRIYREEIFGPVVSILTFEDEQEALSQANDTDAGLSSFIFTPDADRIDRVSRGLRFGEVQVNGVKYGMDMPHGGIKQSGLGHDGSRYALHDYLALKRVSYGITDAANPFKNAVSADEADASTIN
ncbi:aldehyde dehydrogenase [Leucobacter sp. UCD-THU]|uniref:NAD-dependent succinate-semialdehyde dehydrogenase n=1 Tax=Leucobacter sp. UCD-THU TaxID=1292023 RepID=UPI0003683620|nr:NAD-dependent succinate-semialdehyde dehydrogenase [Leucobacter sp. UCD-THU]EYT56599.1 aldehyde dehydrogenase [Leucobacter sp. UCD-THU]